MEVVVFRLMAVVIGKGGGIILNFGELVFCGAGSVR